MIHGLAAVLMVCQIAGPGPQDPAQPGEAPAEEKSQAPEEGGQEDGAEAVEEQAAGTAGDAELAEEAAASAAGDAELAQTVADQQALIEKLEQRLVDVEQQLESEEDAELEALMAAEEQFEPSLNIYGYFDVQLSYYYIDEDDPAHGIVPDKLSFVANRLNLFLAGEIAETVSSLAEVRFTYLPHGYERTYGEPTFLGTQYEREDTRVIDASTNEELLLGGVTIERLYLSWKPWDHFGVLAGRFLTPYGIWNVDHGSPVIIPVRLPFFQIDNAMPSAQTGIQLFGRVYPFSGFYLDYAVTASNGRGPTEAVYDLDNHKALGVRLQSTYEGDDITATLGGYFFWGQTRDVKKEIGGFEPLHLNVITTESYEEYIISADLLLEMFGLRLQGELVRGLVRYDERPLRIYPIVNVEDPMGNYQPDHFRWGVYGLLAYDILLKTDTGQQTLTPFAMIEYYVPDDTYDETKSVQIRWGLNYKPIPRIALKAEVFRSTFPDSTRVEYSVWTYIGQLAVAF